MGMTICIVAIIINKVIFTLSFNIFCNSNKILIKSFSNSLLISDFFYLQLLELVFHFFFLFLPDSLFIIPHVVLTLLWEFRINLSCSVIFAFFITMDSILV